MSLRVLKIGEKAPLQTFRVKKGAEVQLVQSDDEFRDKNVLVLGVPGVLWTDYPSSMIAAYEYNFAKFRQFGIDDIYITSTDDHFTMSRWYKDSEFKNIKYLADGNQEWAKKVGFLVDMQDGGLGYRSHRYVMLFQGGVLKKVFYEDFSHDPHTCFTETNAEKVLEFIEANQKTWMSLGKPSRSVN